MQATLALVTSHSAQYLNSNCPPVRGEKHLDETNIPVTYGQMLKQDNAPSEIMIVVH